MNPRLYWLLLYVSANVIAVILMQESEKLVGDLDGIALYSHDTLLFAAFLVILAYLVILGPVYNYVSKAQVKCAPIRCSDAHIGDRIGIILIVLQVAFMVVNLVTGQYTAGSIYFNTDSLFIKLWAIVPIDALFVIYYGYYRENKYFYPNLLVWTLSNLARGWAGALVFIVFFEWCRAFRNKQITVQRTLFATTVILFIYPIITGFKTIVRSSSITGWTLYDLTNIMFIEYKQSDYLTKIYDTIYQLIGRLQLTSNLVEVIRLRDILQVEFDSGNFSPFWADGLHGNLFYSFFLEEKYVPIVLAFTKYCNTPFEFDVGGWTTNLSYVSWFFVTPHLIPLYLLYTYCLCFLSFVLVKKIGDNHNARDMLWLVWLIYLLPLWLNAFVNFIYALFIFLMLKIIVSKNFRKA